MKQLWQIDKLTSFKSFDSEVPSFYFGSMPSFAHKPVLHQRPILHLSKRTLRPPLRLRLLYCIYTLLMYINTARSTEAEHRLCSKALTSEVWAFYKTFAHIRSGSRCLWKRNPYSSKNQTLRSCRVCTSPTKQASSALIPIESIHRMDPVVI